MKEVILEILKWARESARPFVVLFIVSSLMALCPRTWAGTIGLTDVFPKYRLWGVLAAVASGAWLATTLVETEYRQRQRRKRLHHLTADEKHVLRDFLQTGKRTRHIGWLHAATAETLARAQILTMLANEDGHRNRAFEVNAWAYRHLSDHPELLGVSQT